ncbi:hypothetical protein AURDEDRAFT_70440 [Auricularia subglabra TFB-10046 SS5]|uniref:Glycosyltransferase family 24 protein n=1 Tax=Auricularia subglabra (strain TFB-10046 / SS5) TaxID=717982 RepID=J0DCQ5_AURST|nr:hypothetical protein AURDEDRAFT_70440 [Auricularia subglabra TFB-10046 SS5]
MRSSTIAGLALTALQWRAHAVSPPVKVALRTSWPAPSLLLEIIESAALENPASYFGVLDLLTSDEALPSTTLTSQAIYESSIELLATHGFLSEPGSRESLELALALHAATPKIEAFYQYHSDLNIKAPACGSYVEWYGERVCDAATLRRLVEVDTIDATYPRPTLLTIDHIYPDPSTALQTPNRTAILYASLDSPNFRELHEALLALSKPIGEHQIQYVARYVPPGDRSAAPKSYLSGYGVALDLKKMDYLAMDDRHDGTADEATAEETLLDESAEILHTLVNALDDEQKASALSKEEIAELGLRASQIILDASNPLAMLKEVSQNFPKYALAIGRKASYAEELREELAENQHRVGGGVNVLWLNGMMVQEGDLNPFNLLSILRKERTIMRSLMSAGLSAPQALDLITHPLVADSQSSGEVTDGIFDASDRKEGGGVCVWYNDLTKDSRYAKWSADLKNLRRPMFPGQFPHIKQNLWNVILALDLSQSASLNFIAGSVSNIIQRNFPFRWGIVPLIESDNAAKAARLFYYLIDNYGRAKTTQFLMDLAGEGATSTLDWTVARAGFAALVAEQAPRREDATTDFDAILSGEDGRIEQAKAYAKRLALRAPADGPGYGFVNGKFYDIDDDFFRHLQTEQSAQMEFLIAKVRTFLRKDELAEDVDIENFFYDLPTSSASRNEHIFPSSKSGNALRVANLPDLFGRFSLGTTFEGVAPESAGPFQYLQLLSNANLGYAAVDALLVTLWIVADFDTPEGLAFAKEALKAAELEAATPFRVGFIQNSDPAMSVTLEDSPLRSSHVLYLLAKSNAAAAVSPGQVLLLLDLLEKHDYDEAPVAELFKAASFDKAERTAFGRYHVATRLISRELGIEAGQHGILVNGRVVGPVQPGDFSSADFVTLVKYEISKRIKPVVDALLAVVPELADGEKHAWADSVAFASSIISAIQIPDPTSVGLFQQQPMPRQRVYRTHLQGNHSTFEVGDSSKSIFNFGLLLDPLSEAAQRRVDLLEWLARSPSAHIEVYLNPHGLPLKRFYRYSLRPRLQFGEDGLEVAAFVKFEDLPVDPIYTLGMDVHQSWLVRPHESQHDLDNIHLASLSGRDAVRGVEALFRLDYLVVEGHAREAGTNAPPRGLQLQLNTIGDNSVAIADTQVVANLGYLQFKAKPGIFRLEIREGRGRDIYNLDSVGNEGWESPLVTQVGANIALAGFDGITLYPRFSRKPGMEKTDVLEVPEDAPEEPGFVGKMVNHGQKEPSTDVAIVEDPQADINIFTVASGHLYERFASIMILSVLRHTNSTVKFWFIENFLSPSFLEFIPHLAEAYNFQYELVTYKWPSWLRAQKEKQRIIWGYKILFLDVLFPMDLKKVIFVDADQIVRTDLKELVDLDLQGAPYGYTPMGDDNEAMEGFRFWKTGYWKDFLRGKPYHISALYVIDLVRFRQDRLRGSYQGLSADPHSLANLDQDLPNNLQHEVPIYSLDKDWLWCETWCSMDRLDRAKTIDLCQNPLTKEPKLARARQIPEWSEYDAEIARFARTLAEKGLIHSDAAAVDVDALASVGGGKPAAEKAETEVAPTTVAEATQSDAAEEPESTRTEPAPSEHTRDEL